MAATSGRKMLVKKADTTLMGVRTKTVTINGEPVDVTTDDDAGYRKLLSEAGQKSLDLSIEGIVKDDTLREAIVTGIDLMLEDIEVEYADGGTIAGDFFFTSLEQTGTYNESVTFTAEMQSSGEWTYTAPAS